MRLKDQAMKELIFNHAVIQAAKKEGFVISKSQAQAAIMAIPEFMDDGKFSQALFQQTLSANLYTPQSFIQQVTKGMLINQQRFMFSASSFALAPETDRFIQLATQKRNYRYLTISPSDFASITVSDEAAKAYYDKHQDEFMRQEEVSLDYIELSMKALTDDVKIDDKTIKTYFEENRANYVIPAKYKLAHILIPFKDEKADKETLRTVEKAIKDTASFSDVVKKYSSDLLSQNGELPWMTVGTMGPSFNKAMTSLKVGEVSSPIKTKNGYEIIKLLDKTPAKEQPFDTVKDTIKKTLTLEEAQKQFVQKSEELADLSYQNPESLKPTAKALGLSIQKTPLFTKKGMPSGIGHNPQVIQTAFSDEVLKAGDNSQPIQLNDDALVVIRVSKHKPTVILPFVDVKDKARDIVKAEMQKEKMTSLGETLIKSLKAGQSIDENLKANHLTFKTVNDVLRQDPRIDTPVNQYAFNLKMQAVDTPVIAGKRLPNTNQFVIVVLTKVMLGNPAQMSEVEKQTVTEQLSSSYGVRAYDLYLQSLLKDTKVERK
jgi:peptidyl-prolyl cis-trans isomerase D